MEKVKYTCEVVTPMFLNGADGVTPELRVASIKGGLRYWFRAINRHLSKEDLISQEGYLLGSTNARSQLIIRIAGHKNIHTGQYPLLPHRVAGGRHSFEAFGINPGQQFEVIISCPPKEKAKAMALFELFSIIGGVGKRSRRGMGSFKIIKREEFGVEDRTNFEVSGSVILGLISSIAPGSKYSLKGRSIVIDPKSPEPPYPWIRQIQIGENDEEHYKELLTRIGASTSVFKRRDAQIYEASIGHANGGRFASPIYISVIKQGGLYVPIISTLNTIPDRDAYDIDINFQEQFKTSIL